MFIMPLNRFSDRPALEHLVRSLELLGFSPPKWTYAFDVPIGEIAPCRKRRKFLCDVVGYREDRPVIVFEMDGGHHATEQQKRLDQQKEKILSLHGVRLWRMWNPELAKIWRCKFEEFDNHCAADRQKEDLDEEYARLFRRDLKASMYSPYATLGGDWKQF